jgi:hypothetical protein
MKKLSIESIILAVYADALGILTKNQKLKTKNTKL